MPERPAPLRRGGFMPSIQALRPQPLMNLRGRAGARNRASSAGQGQAEAGTRPGTPIGPRREVFKGRSRQ